MFANTKFVTNVINDNTVWGGFVSILVNQYSVQAEAEVVPSSSSVKFKFLKFS